MNQILFAVIAALLFVAALSYEAEAATFCGPRFSLKKARQCRPLMRACALQGTPMKWTGRGCRLRGRPLGDGGCQCAGYCGYMCKGPCNRDRLCRWEASEGACYVRATNTTGVPILNCPPVGGSSNAPTSSPSGISPTVSPSVPSPTVSPSVPSPSVSPAESSPTVSPTGGSPTVSPTGSSPTVSPTGSSPTVSPTGSSPTVSPTTPTTPAP